MASARTMLITICKFADRLLFWIFSRSLILSSDTNNGTGLVEVTIVTTTMKRKNSVHKIPSIHS